jgi:hypothetical protein
MSACRGFSPSPLALLALAAACGSLDAPPPPPPPAPAPPSEPAAPVEANPGITWEDFEAVQPGCTSEGPTCSRVRIHRAIIADGPEPWRAAARTWIDAQLLRTPKGELAADPKAVGEAMFSDFAAWSAANPMTLRIWAIDRKVELLANTEHLVSFRVTSFTATGEAPVTTVDLASFATADGRILGLADVVGADAEALRTAAEAAFRATWSLPAGRRLAAAGFKFPDGTFTLGESPDLAVGDGALHIQWDAGEVGEEVLGATEIRIPRSEIAAVIPAGAPW